MLRIYKTAEATQYVRAQVVSANDDGPVDPTTFPVFFAFPSNGSTPVDADWVSADWVTSNGYLARIKVGPDGDIDLGATDYSVWVKVVTGDESPEKLAGYLTVE